jgi:SulP family sulfate permease
MTGFVNALGILIFFAQVPHFWSREPLILGLFGLTLLIVLWLPRWVKSIPSPLVAIVLLTVFTVTTGQILPTVGDEGPMQGGLPGFTQWLVPFDLHTLSIIWPCALSIAFVGLMESLLTAKLVDDLTDTRSSKRRESTGLGIANIFAGLYGGIAGCAMIGQTIVNVEMGKGRSRVSTVAAGLVLLLLVTALSEVMAKIPMAVLAGIMVIVAVKTFSWHSIQPAALKQAPVAETLVMLVTVIATVATGNLAIGVAAGVALMFVLPGRRQRAADAKAKTASPDQEK